MKTGRRFSKTLLLGAAISGLVISPAFAQQKNPERNAYFGEQHVHTSWSLDASLGFGDMAAGPEDFYKYALGQPMTHVGGYKVRITKPLDWGATTEHAEYLGVYPQVLDPTSPVRRHAPFLSEAIKAGGRADGLLTYKLLSVTLVKGHPIKELRGPEVLAPVWKRLVEIPTPRWSTIQAVKMGRVPPTIPGPGIATATIQERAWTSPIWYTPGPEARRAAKPGLTVAELKRKRAVALGDAELKQLIVGNTVTGQRFEILYGSDGRRLITAVDGKAPDLDVMGELQHGPQMQYEIRDGHLVTEVAGAEFDVTVYKLGDKYVASRSREFGYANYEVEDVK